MFGIKPNLVVLLIFLYYGCINCQRRIQNGSVLAVPKPYVVYIVKAPISTKRYDYWLCGGALVSSEFVVTSAACVSDVNYLYVIAGYDTYVRDHSIEYDQCTKRMKKKVIYTCYPDGYSIEYERLDKWSLIDIALVRVESPYNFEDEDYKTYCSYIPATIAINYEAKYQEPGTDAIVFGWGSRYYYRKEDEKKDLNQDKLHYAPVLIMEKEKCKVHYEVYNNMSQVIDRYMICSLESGSIDDKGEEIELDKEITGCTSTGPSLLNYVDLRCQEDDDQFRRRIKKINQKFKDIYFAKMNKTVSFNKTNIFNKTLDLNNTTESNITSENARRHGICQVRNGNLNKNDHGGPLVSWVGTHEVLIGVASVFKVSEDFECIGPYLYTSTQCNGAFLECVLSHQDWPDFKNKDKDKSRRALCKKSPDDKGHATVERHISWLYHPAGPADNEKHKTSGRTAQKKSIPPKKRGPFQEQFAENEKYAPNAKYQVNERYTADEKYVPNDKYPANIRYPANDKYAPNVQYATERSVPINVFTRNEGYKISNRYDPYNKYGANDNHEALARFTGQYVLNEQYTTNANVLRYGNVNNDGLVMRPQVPLRV